jgi:hypothetical protein
MCRNPATQVLLKRVTKFTLFFIPLFPISSKFQAQCTFCGQTTKLTKEQGQEFLQQVAVIASPVQLPQQQNSQF